METRKKGHLVSKLSKKMALVSKQPQKSVNLYDFYMILYDFYMIL